ncbi:MAG: hypothetical protein AAFO87_08265 [Cyanobacteria bacterium J06607_6]
MPPFLSKPSILRLLALWAGFGALSWLWYAPFTGGQVPGWHGLALGYSYLRLPALLISTSVGLALPALGAGLFGLLLLRVLKPQWQPVARRAAVLLAIAISVGVLLSMAAFPAVLFGYAPQSHQAIAAWHKIYRTVYVAPPFDDNYGPLMLLECGRWGLCHEVYRGYTDVFSAAVARVEFQAGPSQLALYLENEWAYVRSRPATLCVAQSAALDGSSDAVICDFPIEN